MNFEYSRLKNQIIHNSTGVISAYKSITKAKRASRALKMAGKTMRVIK